MSISFFNSLLWIWISIAVIIFIILFRTTAPYGRHTKNNWGPMINNKLGWFIMEVPSLIVFSAFVLAGRGINLDVLGLISVLYIFHYVYRSIVFPLRIKTGTKKMPLVIALSAILFNLINGSTNGYWIGTLSEPVSDSWLSDPRFIVGIILFILGFCIHAYHDNMLINLRKNNNNDYQIPSDGLFNYISSPNYFGEILEWLGFALMCWSPAALSFLVWTCANLVPRAYKNHQWYKERFHEYPLKRRAIIPLIW